ncbi:hypothetical protein PQ478_04985 [Alkalihalophilus pseudofirmus]|uniref:hypothetical protein n=1 Tax=Alkalihalophilus pseudofirmus TaxID=79885 RepID=UPI00259B6A9F|nr:hypothetical protein [Alkalihalophilus pseudofirmus]WEG17851.1 hypothetical protein PQ478_04985 [Alkalihalophilus pseudofirmus]
MELLLTLLVISGIIYSVFFIQKKRREHHITGWKSLITSVCFISIALINAGANLFGMLGLISWGLTIFLLLMGAYFTKYLPVPQER